MEVRILNPQAKYAETGVTSFQDVYVRDMVRMQAYFKIESQSEMSIRGQVINVLEYIQELYGRSVIQAAILSIRILIQVVL